MNIEEVIRKHLENHLDMAHLDIKDRTGKHVHHEQFTGGHHLSAIIVSDTFESMGLLDRHQLVYNALGKMIKNEIHAFSMETYTPKEWGERLN